MEVATGIATLNGRLNGVRRDIEKAEHDLKILQDQRIEAAARLDRASAEFRELKFALFLLEEGASNTKAQVAYAMKQSAVPPYFKRQDEVGEPS